MSELTWVIEKDVFSEDVIKETADIISELFPDDTLITTDYALSDTHIKPPLATTWMMRGSFGLSNRITSWMHRSECTKPILYNFYAFHFTSFAPFFKAHLLNEEFNVCKLVEVPVGVWFVRPNSGHKTFSGDVFNTGKLAQEISFLEQHNMHPEEIDVIYSSPITIDEEYRCIMVKGKVVESSSYSHEKEYVRNYSNKASVHAFANQFDFPFEDYVLDVCLADGAYKVVECNSLLTSSYYACDRELVYTKIREMMCETAVYKSFIYDKFQ